jgi:hypothetical protein
MDLCGKSKPIKTKFTVGLGILNLPNVLKIIGIGKCKVGSQPLGKV